ncbi:MAG: DNA gyrase subunit A [Candidatus Carbobacillus altaicus]|nr:DNA gyrase subunit A [Candidatus Carbobacillus altaicus]
MLDEQKVVGISQEMKSSFIDYAMSVIVSRALPDVRDGLKPVHRRILYAMLQEGMTPDRPQKKSAHIVGGVIAKYHPHGDAAVYETMVRMAQDFSYRYPLVDGQGNFGSVDGDAPAAMRYTEARLAPIAMQMLRDIKKDTVDFQDNYDGSEKEPTVLPARFPQLLANGASGIAVGMATNIPPHNLSELIDALFVLLDDEDASDEAIMKKIPGPDFPTGGIILGRDGIEKAYTTGRGSIIVRARTEVEPMSGGRFRIIATELPYQVNKARLIEKIAELVRDKKLDGITDLRDESDREGMRIVIEVRRDTNPHVLLNNLYKHTQMQTTFGVIMLALVDGRPEVLSLKAMLKAYLDHQKTVVRRRTAHDLDKASARKHIIDGLKKAIDIVDALVDRHGPIRSARDRKEARQNLMQEVFTIDGKAYPMGFTEAQADAILEMRLEQLTGLSIERLLQEEAELAQNITEYERILADPDALKAVIRKELQEVQDAFRDARRTHIVEADGSFSMDDLIDDEAVVISLSHHGYIKRVNASEYKAQRRGGRGVQGVGLGADDFIEHLLSTSAHQTILFFTNRGRVYRLRAYDIPAFSRQAKGMAIVNLLELDPGERIQTMIDVQDFNPDRYLFFVTKQGMVKRTALSEFMSIRRVGLLALTLREDDELISVRLTRGAGEMILGTRKGFAIRFKEEDVRPMGRTASGVRGIDLSSGDEVIGADEVKPDHYVLTVTRLGFGKRTPIEEYRLQSRGGKGIKAYQLTDKVGALAGLAIVKEEDEVMIISENGVLIRIPVRDISVLGRVTQGVRLIRMDEGDLVAAIAHAPQEDEGD